MSEAKALPEQTRGIGDNSRSIAHPEVVQAELREKYADLIVRQRELIASEPTLPTTVDDEETSGEVGDQIKQFDNCAKALEGARVAEKEPYLQGGRLVDGLFNSLRDPLINLRKRLDKIDGVYKDAKVERERKQREAEERRKREEAERLRAEAEERARQAREAEERAQRAKEEAERKLREEQERQERERQEREAAARKAEEDARRREESRIQAARDEDERRQAEQQRAIREAADKARKEAEDKARAEYEAKERKRLEDERVEREKREKVEAKERERLAEEAKKVADKAEREAAAATKAANASTAELSRTRGQYGSVGNRRTTWEHDESSLDRNTLDLRPLRPHLPEAALHQAVRSYIRAGGRELKGVKIFEARASTYR
jgi:chemotaxis protein histidine kinase CheA